MCDVVDFPKNNRRNRIITYDFTSKARGSFEALIRFSIVDAYDRLEARHWKGLQTSQEILDLMEALQVFVRDWDNTGLNTPQGLNSAFEALADAANFLDYGLPGLYLELKNADGR